MLEVRDLCSEYGLIRAVQGVSIRVEEGEVIALLGPNGAGKSTLLKTVVGLKELASGSVSFDGQELTGVAPDRIVRAGVSLVPEGRKVFAGLTVAENLRLGAAIHQQDRAANAETESELLELFPILASRYSGRAELLSGGEQQQLAIARALMSRPRMLLLDEPSLGLAPKLVDQIYELMDELRRRGRTLLVVEQHAYKASALADRVYVMNSGRLEYSGDAADLRETHLMEAYFGS